MNNTKQKSRLWTCLLLCSFSPRIVTGRHFAHEDGILADNVDILPAYPYAFTSAADTEISRSAVDDYRHHAAAAGIHLDIAHKPYAAAVRLVDNLLASQLGYAAVHWHPSIVFTIEVYAVCVGMMNNYSPSVYLLSIFAVGANIATVAAELMQALSRLKGIIAGISSSATFFAP